VKAFNPSVGAAFILATASSAQAPGNLVPVTADNLNRAETDMRFASDIKQAGGIRRFHHREVMPIDNQTVIRTNRDTLDSTAVFDLDIA
jgi:hypothetical protein